jgi:hypothetical protein
MARAPAVDPKLKKLLVNAAQARNYAQMEEHRVEAHVVDRLVHHPEPRIRAFVQDIVWLDVDALRHTRLPEHVFFWMGSSWHNLATDDHFTLDGTRKVTPLNPSTNPALALQVRQMLADYEQTTAGWQWWMPEHRRNSTQRYQALEEASARARAAGLNDGTRQTMGISPTHWRWFLDVAAGQHFIQNGVKFGVQIGVPALNTKHDTLEQLLDKWATNPQAVRGYVASLRAGLAAIRQVGYDIDTRVYPPTPRSFQLEDVLRHLFAYVPGA